MATTLRVDFEAAQARNALLAIQNRLEGVLTSGEPIEIMRGASYLEVTLGDEVVQEQVQAAIKTLANLVNRPESGITSAVVTTPENRDSYPRVYSA
jgi:hypothetical protein